jgi:hypothetical protein
MKTTQRLWLPILCVGFLQMIHPGVKPACGQGKEKDKTPPIELSNIRMEYAVLDEAGKLRWETPSPETPNVIPSGAQKLRFTAKVTNRPLGSKIRVKFALQEICSSPDPGKAYLARLRHLTETEKEVEVSRPNAEFAVELEVHCEECVHAVCGRECPDKDHLGEGPHQTTVTVTDPGTGGKNVAAAKPASVRMEIQSVCPKKPAKPVSN